MPAAERQIVSRAGAVVDKVDAGTLSTPELGRFPPCSVVVLPSVLG